MNKHNKQSAIALIDGTLGATYLTAPCYRLMGAVLAQAVSDYRRLYRQHIKNKAFYSYLGTKYSVEWELNDLKKFFRQYCEGTRLDADELMAQMEATAFNDKRLNGMNFEEVNL